MEEESSTYHSTAAGASADAAGATAGATADAAGETAGAVRNPAASAKRKAETAEGAKEAEQRKELASRCVCPVCFSEPCLPPILQCVSGHAICGTCFAKIESQVCPTCRIDMSNPGRNRVAEGILEQSKVEVSCPVCDISVAYGLFKEHRCSKDCVARVQCPCCREKFLPNSIANHVASRHGALLYTTRALSIQPPSSPFDRRQSTSEEIRTGFFIESVKDKSYFPANSDCATPTRTQQWLKDYAESQSYKRQFAFDTVVRGEDILRFPPTLQYGSKNGFLTILKDEQTTMPNGDAWPPILFRFFVALSASAPIPPSTHVKEQKKLGFTITFLCNDETLAYMKTLPNLHIMYNCSYTNGDDAVSDGISERWRIKESRLFDQMQIHYFSVWNSVFCSIYGYEYRFKLKICF